MLQQILTATPSALPWLTMIGFGAYHGLNPGMGWLFALSVGLQQRSERAIWLSLLPITAGHAASLVLVAVLVLTGFRFIPAELLQLATGLMLIGFGLYKVFRYYRHPRWVGMKVGMRDLARWSFLMAMAHGAGLMIAPALLDISAAAEHGEHAAHAAGSSGSAGVLLGVLLHTGAMLLVMSIIAWFVYRRFGLAVLRQKWINFDLIWALALLVVGGIALLQLFL
jgi:hypothetical protein